MKILALENMVKGWFVGDFEPSAHKTKDFEVAIKYYKKGDVESAHVHRQAFEITAVVSGQIRMRGKTLGQGEIIYLEPGESTDFEALEDCATVVVKSPSVRGDKFNV